MIKITDAIHQHPAGTFLAFLALHAVVWTVLPAVFFLNLPLDLIEGLLYGREWQLGYDKLPPLPWWMLEATYRLFGPDLFFYALSQATRRCRLRADLGHGAAAGRPGRRAGRGPDHRRPALFHVHGAQIQSRRDPTAVLGADRLCLLGGAPPRPDRALGFARVRHRDGVWAKYFVVVQAAPLVLFALFDRDARKALATPGPWLAVAVALVVMAPHLVWLVQNDFLPFAYADARAVQFKGALDYLIKPPRFLLSQLGFLAAVAADRGALSAARRARAGTAGQSELELSADAFDRRIVTLLAFGPAAMIVLLSLETGRDAVALWGYPLWLFLGLWIVLNARLA